MSIFSLLVERPTGTTNMSQILQQRMNETERACIDFSRGLHPRLLADLKDPGSVQLRPIKDSGVYLWGWGPCPPHRKVHSSGLFPAGWCQNCTHPPSESLEGDDGHKWAAQELSKASLEENKKPSLIALDTTRVNSSVNGRTYLRRARASRRSRRTSGSWPGRNPWFSKQIGCPPRSWRTSDFHGSLCSCCEGSSYPGGEER